MDTLKQFESARRVSVPLMIWKTPDPAASISAAVNSADDPVLSWDIVRGLMPCNEKAKAIRVQTDEGTVPVTGIGIGNPPQMLDVAQKFPADTVVFMHNAHLFTNGGDGSSNSMVVQAMWNLRDTNKADHKMLVLLTPSMKSPMELANDIMVIDESLPDDKALAEIVKAQGEYARTGAKDNGIKFKELSDKDVERAVDALAGLSAFAAEQTVAVSFEKNGDGVSLNFDKVWDNKRQAIEETRGLKVWRDGETLDDVKGCENIKEYVRRIINGRKPPRAIVFIDEIEKQLGGVSGDTSGTSQDQLNVVLIEMQNKKADGMIFVGPGGSAKSMVAKAMGNTAGVVTMAMDLGAMKESHVGDSERNIRTAMKVIDSVSQGRALYVATCNKIQADSMPPELKRRFTLGTFYFDLPTRAERVAIWAYYLKKHGLKDKVKDGIPVGVDEDGWTGADIENCCKRAWMFNCSVVEAAKYATPICKTDPQSIEKLRSLADGAFISANYEGLYRKEDKQTVSLGDAGKRKMTFK